MHALSRGIKGQKGSVCNLVGSALAPVQQQTLVKSGQIMRVYSKCYALKIESFLPILCLFFIGFALIIVSLIITYLFMFFLAAHKTQLKHIHLLHSGNTILPASTSQLR